MKSGTRFSVSVENSLGNKRETVIEVYIHTVLVCFLLDLMQALVRRRQLRFQVHSVLGLSEIASRSENHRNTFHYVTSYPLATASESPGSGCTCVTFKFQVELCGSHHLSSFYFFWGKRSLVRTRS